MNYIPARMTDEQRSALEAHRTKHGLKSLNAAICHLIDNAHMVPTKKQVMGAPYLEQRISDEDLARSRDAAATRAYVFATSPQPSKPGSRLKKGKGK